MIEGLRLGDTPFAKVIEREKFYPGMIEDLKLRGTSLASIGEGGNFPL